MSLFYENRGKVRSEASATFGHYATFPWAVLSVSSIIMQPQASLNRWVMAYQEPDRPIQRDFKSLNVVKSGSLAGIEANCYGIALDTDGNLYASVGSCIVRCKKGDTKFEVYAGVNGTAGQAVGSLTDTRFSSPLGLYWHERSLYVAHSHAIIRITGESSQVLAGKGSAGYKDGPSIDASFNNPTHIVWLQDAFYVTDTFNHAIRKISEGYVSTLVKSVGDETLTDGPFGSASLRYPRGISIGLNNTLLVVQSSNLTTIRTVDLAAKEIRQHKYKQKSNYAFSMDVLFTPSRELLVCDTTNEVVFMTDTEGTETRLLSLTGNDQSIPSSHTITRPTASCISPEGDLYISSEKSYIIQIKRMFPPRELADFDFSPTLEFSSPQALPDPTNPSSFVENKSINDLVLVQQNSGRGVAMSAHMAKLLEFSTPGGLETCIVPFEACESFLKLVFGQTSSIPRNTSATEIAFYLVIAEAMGASHDLKQILRAELADKLASLTFSELSLVAAEAFSVGESSTDLKRVFAAETTKRKGSSEVQDLVTSLSLASIEPQIVQFQSLVYASTSMWLQSRLAVLTERLSLEKTASTGGAGTNAIDFPPNFTFEIPSGTGDTSVYIGAHDWILMPRWSFFKRMMQSGLDESHQHKATLPSDFAPHIALVLLQYIYSGAIMQQSLSAADCEFLLQNAAAYGITDLEDAPFRGFEPLYHYCKANANPTAAAAAAADPNLTAIIPR